MTLLDIFSCIFTIYFLYMGYETEKKQQQLMSFATSRTYLLSKFLDDHVRHAEKALETDIEARKALLISASQVSIKIPLSLFILCAPAIAIYFVPANYERFREISVTLISIGGLILLVCGLIMSVRLFAIGLTLKWRAIRSALTFYWILVKIALASYPFIILLSWHTFVNKVGIGKAFFVLLLIPTLIEKIAIPLLIH